MPAPWFGLGLVLSSSAVLQLGQDGVAAFGIVVKRFHCSLSCCPGCRERGRSSRSRLRHSRSSMNRRIACLSSSLTERSSSFITRRACASISGGREKAMVLNCLGVVTLSFPSTVECLTTHCQNAGFQPLQRGITVRASGIWALQQSSRLDLLGLHGRP